MFCVNTRLPFPYVVLLGPSLFLIRLGSAPLLLLSAVGECDLTLISELTTSLLLLLAEFNLLWKRLVGFDEISFLFWASPLVVWSVEVIWVADLRIAKLLRMRKWLSFELFAIHALVRIIFLWVIKCLISPMPWQLGSHYVSPDHPCNLLQIWICSFSVPPLYACIYSNLIGAGAQNSH